MSSKWHLVEVVPVAGSKKQGVLGFQLKALCMLRLMRPGVVIN